MTNPDVSAQLEIALDQLDMARLFLRGALAAARRENLPEALIQHTEHVMATSDNLVAELDTILAFLDPPSATVSPCPTFSRQPGTRPSNAPPGRPANEQA